MFSQGPFQVREQLDQSRLGQRIEQVEQGWLGRKDKFSGVAAKGLQGEALLRIALVFADVFLSHAMQFRQKFDSDDAAERVVGGHEQSSSLARADVDEGEITEVEVQACQHFVKQRRIGRLVR